MNVHLNLPTFIKMKRRNFLKKAGLFATSAGLLSLNVPEQEKIAPSIKIPKALVKGDLIGITAPAGTIWNDYHIRKIEKILTDMGYRVKIGASNYKQVAYLAGTDESRAAELMEMFKDTSIKAILTMRGGWGCARILDLLDYKEIIANPKIIMGFSDITSLVNAIYARTGLITFHGPCGYSSWGDFTKEHVTNSLISGAPYEMVNPSGSEHELRTLTSGKAKGKLIGGNLTVIQSMLGTNYEPVWDNNILFIEETNEEPYRIDRMLWHLKQYGVFEQVNGVVIGSFNKCNPEEPEKSFSLNEVFDQHFKNVNFPVYQGASFGHLADKFTLPIGVMAEIDADNFTIKTLGKSVLQ